MEKRSIDDEMKIPVKPIVLTKFEHKGEQYGCGDYAEGFFARDQSGFSFEIYFDAEPGDETYGSTRMGEIYFKTEDDLIEWTWHSGHREAPGTEYMHLLLADLLAGIDAAIQDRIMNNRSYCVARINCLVDQLLHAGLEPLMIVSALAEGLKRTVEKSVA